MREEDLIPAQEFCLHHNIEINFLASLQEYGLIEITTIEQNQFIDADQLSDLEKIVRLHYDLDINIAGIEAITHLLKKVEVMQGQIALLRNRLRIHEAEV